MDTLVSMKVFRLVVEAGSFVGAAERLNLSAAMASKHVAHLEQQLGARLLNRTTRRVAPTEAGREYYERLAQALTELDEAGFVDGLSSWGVFLRIILPIALPGMVAAFILSLILCWNEYFFAALLTGSDAKTLPVMVASQTGSQGINWWSMAALASAAILPLIIVGVFLERYIIKGLTAGSVK